MSEIIPINAGTYSLFSSDLPDAIFEACAHSPAKILELLQDAHRVDVATGWMLVQCDKSSGVVNLRGVRSDECGLLFGGVVGSSWYPDNRVKMHAVLSRGHFSVRVQGYTFYADDEVSDQEWKNRPLPHRFAYYAVRAAQGTPASPRAISDALNSGFVNGTLAPGSLGARPSDWQCFWVCPTEVRFTFLGEHRVHRYIDFTKRHGDVNFTVSRNA